MEEQDITNFSTSSSHRLPTVSATQALELAAQRAKRTPLGLPKVDALLKSADGTSGNGGVPRGQVTEVYGPPGVGKTAIALQTAVNAINSNDAQSHVVWINTGSAVVPRRVQSFVSGYRMPLGQEPASSPPAARSRTDLLAKMSFIEAQSLPRLLTLFLHPTARFPPPHTTMIVVDDLSNLVHGSFPKSKGKSATPNGAREKMAQKAASRKWAVLADLANAMSKMAVINNVAILVINQTATSLINGQRAALKPALSSQAWNQAVQTRILLYRDFLPPGSVEGIPPSIAQQLRFAEVVKLNGKDRDYGHSPTTFVIRKGGIREIDLRVTPQQPPEALITEPTRAGKRKAEEIADSEDEAEADEVGSDDDLGLPAEDDSDVEILGDNKTLPTFTATSRDLPRGGEASALPVRASPRKCTNTKTKAADEDEGDDEDDEPLTSSGNEQDFS